MNVTDILLNEGDTIPFEKIAKAAQEEDIMSALKKAIKKIELKGKKLEIKNYTGAINTISGKINRYKEYSKSGTGNTKRDPYRKKTSKAKLTRLSLEQLKKLKGSLEKLKEEKGSNVRGNNEGVIELALREFIRVSKIKNVVLDFKGTNINIKSNDLKRDELMKLPGIPAFKFEAKKYNPNLLLSKGVPFAAIRRGEISLKKEEKNTPEGKKKVAEYNENLNKAFTKEEIKRIRMELFKSTSKSENPYLLVGGMTPETIKVVYPDQYFLDTRIDKSYSVNRIEIVAKAKGFSSMDKVFSLKEFLNRMMVENLKDFTREILNG